MPTLIFTVGEVADSLIDEQRRLSQEIRDLADLDKKPLTPGESVAERYHALAKLGKQLAETFDMFDKVMRATATGAEAAEPASNAPTTPDNSQAN